MTSTIFGGAGYGYSGASANRLMGDWRVWDPDPNDVWTADAPVIAGRAWDLIRNDPVMAAATTAKLVGTHGSEGLRLRSLYAEGDDPETSQAEADTRRAIDEEIRAASCGTSLDASGLLTRLEMETQLDLCATVSGEAYLVRCWLPNRPGARTASCWKLIRPERVSNPHGRPDSAHTYQGWELDPATGGVLGVWIGPPLRFGLTKAEQVWTFVPWIGEDGSRNVIHRTGMRVPGGYRGVSCYASALTAARHCRGVVEAYVVAKRVQACHPIFIEVDDPVAAAANDSAGAVWNSNNTTIEPGKVYYVQRGGGVHFASWQFNGSDLRDFLDTYYRNIFASWGLPVDVVLAHLNGSNMAGSRSAWLQYYRRSAIWQDEHIEQCSKVIDEAILRERIAFGALKLPLGVPPDVLMRGQYKRPPRHMPDPLKEAQAVREWIAVGRDFTGLYADQGLDFRESIRQRAEDDRDMKAQGVDISGEPVGERIITEPQDPAPAGGQASKKEPAPTPAEG